MANKGQNTQRKDAVPGRRRAGPAPEQQQQQTSAPHTQLKVRQHPPNPQNSPPNPLQKTPAPPAPGVQPASKGVLPTGPSANHPERRLTYAQALKKAYVAPRSLTPFLNPTWEVPNSCYSCWKRCEKWLEDVALGRSGCEDLPPDALDREEAVFLFQDEDEELTPEDSREGSN